MKAGKQLRDSKLTQNSDTGESDNNKWVKQIILQLLILFTLMLSTSYFESPEVDKVHRGTGGWGKEIRTYLKVGVRELKF